MGVADRWGEGANVPRVLIAHDDRLLVEALAFVLRSQGHVVATLLGCSARTALVRAAEWRPAVVVLGMELRRDASDGLAVVDKLAGQGAAVVAFVEPQAHSLQAACLEAGAAALVAADIPLADFTTVVTRVAAGERLLGSAARHAILVRAQQAEHDHRERWAAFESLTCREREVLLAIMGGHNATQIAELTYVSVTTVRTHIRSLLSKLGVSSQLAAVALAVQMGWPDARRLASPALSEAAVAARSRRRPLPAAC